MAVQPQDRKICGGASLEISAEHAVGTGVEPLAPAGHQIWPHFLALGRQDCDRWAIDVAHVRGSVKALVAALS